MEVQLFLNYFYCLLKYIFPFILCCSVHKASHSQCVLLAVAFNKVSHFYMICLLKVKHYCNGLVFFLPFHSCKDV